MENPKPSKKKKRRRESSSSTITSSMRQRLRQLCARLLLQQGQGHQQVPQQGVLGSASQWAMERQQSSIGDQHLLQRLCTAATAPRGLAASCGTALEALQPACAGSQRGDGVATPASASAIARRGWPSHLQPSSGGGAPSSSSCWPRQSSAALAGARISSSSSSSGVAACRALSTSDAAAHGGGGGGAGGESIAVTFVEKDGTERTVQAHVGDSLLQVAHENEIDLEGACEGSLACSTCHVVVENDEYFKKLPEPTEDELDMLDLAFGLTETSRLGCQIIASKELDGIKVRIPAASRNFYVDGHKPKPH